MSRPTNHHDDIEITNSEFNTIVNTCRSLPQARGNYLVNDYIENLLLTVLDFRLHETIIHRAMEYYRHNTYSTVRSHEDLRSLLAKQPDTKAGNEQIAKYLWGYRYSDRVQLLRRLLEYFEQRGVIDQDTLHKWAFEADFKCDFEGKVKGAGLAIFKWLVMRQGVETIKPDIWVHRFIHDTIGRYVSDTVAVTTLEKAAGVLKIRAYELDWRIWEYQRETSAKK